MKDLTGKRVGRLVAICPTFEKRQNSIVWECRCDCGKIVKMSASLFNTGRIKSCGCWLKDRTSQLEYNGKRYSFKEFAQMHNLGTQLVRGRWRNGLRGEYLISPPGTLPRKKYNKNKETCYRDDDGSVINFAELATELGMSRWGVMLRYFAGCRGADLRRPKDSKPCKSRVYGRRKSYNKTKTKVEYNGRMVGLSELSDLTHISYGTLLERYKKGYRGEMLVFKTLNLMVREVNRGQE